MKKLLCLLPLLLLGASDHRYVPNHALQRFANGVYNYLESTPNNHWGMDRTSYEFQQLQRAFRDGEDAQAIRHHAQAIAAAAFMQALFAELSENESELAKRP